MKFDFDIDAIPHVDALPQDELERLNAERDVVRRIIPERIGVPKHLYEIGSFERRVDVVYLNPKEHFYYKIVDVAVMDGSRAREMWREGYSSDDLRKLKPSS